MTWVDWTYTKLDSGYMYCCSVEEAREGHPMPEIKTAGLIDPADQCWRLWLWLRLLLYRSVSRGSCNPAGDSYSCTCACDGQIVAMD